MKRLVIIAMMLLGLHAFAQEDNVLPEKTQKIIGQIEEANADVGTVCGGFRQTKKIFANGRKVNSEGMLYYACPDRFAMHYSEPEGELMVISGDRMAMTRGKKNSVYDLQKNAPMRSLSSTLLLSMQGKVMEIASLNDADVAASIEEYGIKVSLYARKKASKGYSMIELVYNPGGRGLKSMVMVEFNGNSTVYDISGADLNTEVGSEPFAIE